MERIDNLPSGEANSTVPAPLRSEGLVKPRDIDALEEAFVRAHALERREPGGGKWPFAGDGPWHLIQGEQGDYGGDGQDAVSDSREPRPPLDAEEVAELAELRRWLGLVPADARKLVWIATARLHAGEGRVPWTAIARWLGLKVALQTVMRRYRRALATAVCALNGWPTSRVKAMAR